MVSYQQGFYRGSLRKRVLILIVVEDGLVQRTIPANVMTGQVLILIVVEDGLVQT